MNTAIRTASVAVFVFLVSMLGMGTANAAQPTHESATTPGASQTIESDPLTITNNLPYPVEIITPVQQRIEAGQTISIRTWEMSRGIIGFVSVPSGNALLNADIFVFHGQWKTISVYFNTVPAHVTTGDNPSIVLG